MWASTIPRIKSQVDFIGLTVEKMYPSTAKHVNGVKGLIAAH